MDSVLGNRIDIRIWRNVCCTFVNPNLHTENTNAKRINTKI